MDHFGFLTPCFLIYIGHQLCDLVTLISHNIERLCIKQVEIKKEIIDVDIEEVQQLQVGIFRREATSPEVCLSKECIFNVHITEHLLNDLE